MFLFVGATIGRPRSRKYEFAQIAGEKVTLYCRAIDDRPYIRVVTLHHQAIVYRKTENPGRICCRGCAYRFSFAQEAISSSLSLTWCPLTDRPSATTAPGQEAAMSLGALARPEPSLVQRGMTFLPDQS